MTIDSDITAIQNCITNPLDHIDIGNRRIAGVIGDRPSYYSKSPALWNAALIHLDMNEIYLPFDVDALRLRDLVSALRDCHRFLGMNVTVPHKVRIMEFLDELDPGAERIQAVNTVVKTPSGRLVGYNTDGEGFIESILTPQPGQQRAFIKSLQGIDVLLLGAGGSARAVAFHLSDHLDGGKLVTSNRTFEHAASLAAEIQKLGGNAVAIAETEISDWAPKVSLIINSTTKGQGGRRKPHDEATILEPFSSLAPARTTVLPHFDGNDAEARQRWRALAGAAIEANNKVSLAIAASIPKAVSFYDLIYYPEETVFLRHGTLTGHPTMNGKSMIINQAVIAFCRRICRPELQARGIDNPGTTREILEVMYRAW
jgi:shikimate dehydrogenase